MQKHLDSVVFFLLSSLNELRKQNKTHDTHQKSRNLFLPLPLLRFLFFHPLLIMQSQDGVVAPTMQQSLIVVKGWLSPHDLQRREGNPDPLFAVGGSVNDVATLQMHELTFAFRRDLHMDGSVMSKGTPVFSAFNGLGKKPIFKEKEDEDERLYKVWKARQALKRQLIYAGIAQTDTMVRYDPNNERNRSPQGISKAMFGTATIEFNGVSNVMPMPGHWLVWDVPNPTFVNMRGMDVVDPRMLTSNQKHPNKIVAELKIVDASLFHDRARYYRQQYLYEQVMYRQYRKERQLSDKRHLVGQGPIPPEQTLVATSDLEALYQEERSSFIQGMALATMMMRNPTATLNADGDATVSSKATSVFYKAMATAAIIVDTGDNVDGARTAIDAQITASVTAWAEKLGFTGNGHNLFASVVGAAMLHPQEMIKFQKSPGINPNTAAGFNGIAYTLLRKPASTFIRNSDYRVFEDNELLLTKHLANSFTDRVEASMSHSHAISNDTIGKVDAPGSTGNQIHITTGIHP
jgi:hypothetical protein